MDRDRGRRLQLIPHRALRDHMPVVVEFEYLLAFDTCQESRTRWNRDALMAQLSGGAQQFTLVSKVNKELGNQEEDIEKLPPHRPDRGNDKEVQVPRSKTVARTAPVGR